MCPAMTAGPTSPGLVPSAYHPASLKLGVARVPSVRRVSCSRSVLTKILGIRSAVGAPWTGLVAGADRPGDAASTGLASGSPADQDAPAGRSGSTPSNPATSTPAARTPTPVAMDVAIQIAPRPRGLAR